MINYFSLKNDRVVKEKGSKFSKQNIIWVDLINATDEEILHVEKTFNVDLFTKLERKEIETSSKYIETIDEIKINLNFISVNNNNNNYFAEPVSFIIKNKTLITQREQEYKAFEEMYKKLELNLVHDGDDIYIQILDLRIDLDADIIELITDKITAINKELTGENQIHKNLLLKITALQETTIIIRENIVEKHRVISAMMKSKIFPKEDFETMKIMLEDVNSLLEHTGFNFERLEFLQDSFLGLVNMEQNRIIKIFTVVTVIFLPPTLIASVYGMNFDFMPELKWKIGYPLAVVMMILSSVFTLLFFKKKKWL